MKKYFLIVLYLLFAMFIVFAGYLYSLRCNFVSWGSSLHDGLFFLAFYIFILPALLIIGIAKNYLAKRVVVSIKSNNFFYCTMLVALPALDLHGTQVSLLAGCIVSLICFVYIMIIGFREITIQFFAE
jgi:hypothetical protein